MPRLAPKQMCMNCGKDLGRRWKEALCSSCAKKALEVITPQPATYPKDDIPY